MWIKHISRIAHGGFDNSSSFLNSFDADLKLIDVIERIEDTEDVDTVFLCILAEVVDGIIRKSADISALSAVSVETNLRRVGDAVGTT